MDTNLALRMLGILTKLSAKKTLVLSIKFKNNWEFSEFQLTLHICLQVNRHHQEECKAWQESLPQRKSEELLNKAENVVIIIHCSFTMVGWRGHFPNCLRSDSLFCWKLVTLVYYSLPTCVPHMHKKYYVMKVCQTN